jgi:hypothetical protein
MKSGLIGIVILFMKCRVLKEEIAKLRTIGMTVHRDIFNGIFGFSDPVSWYHIDCDVMQF